MGMVMFVRARATVAAAGTITAGAGCAEPERRALPD